VAAEEDLNVLLSIGRALLTEPRKMLLAGKKTTVYQSWTAEHLGMKNAANVSRVIHRIGSSRIEKNFSATLKCFFSEKLKGNEP
jgi:hypothetical protein